MNDPYLDPQAGILRNLTGATTQRELDNDESELVRLRMLAFPERTLWKSSYLGQLQEIHHYLFQDLYEWAGDVRTIDMTRNVDFGAYFCPAVSIDRGMSWFEDQLRTENELRNLERERFVGRLAFYYGELNYMHPFRDGNGRTQRIFWSRFVSGSRYSLDWTATSRDENDVASAQAMARGVDATSNGLVAMFNKVVQPAIDPLPVDAYALGFPH